MQKDYNEMDSRALLQEIAEIQQRHLFYARITLVVCLIIAAAMIVGLAIALPRITETVSLARTTMNDVQALVSRLNSSLDSLDSIVDVFQGFDLSSLTSAIQKLSALVESLSSFKLFG